MTVRQMLEQLESLPLDNELYIEVDLGDYYQTFSIDSFEIPHRNEILFQSRQLNEIISEEGIELDINIYTDDLD